MSYAIEGKTALVTGANRGIGKALVEALFAAGAAKVYGGARNPHDLAPLVARYGAKLVALRLDVTDDTAIAAAAAQATDVQLLVNNAGVAAQFGGAFTDPGWIVAGRQEMDVNYFGALALSQAFAPVLSANGGGAIVNIGSVVSFVAFPSAISYSASKAATHSLTQATRLLLKAQGTQVFGVYPGPIETRMSEAVPVAKTAAEDAARAIVAGIESGVEEIFPDPTSQQMGAAYLVDPKSLERHVADMTAAMANV